MRAGKSKNKRQKNEKNEEFIERQTLSWTGSLVGCWKVLERTEREEEGAEEEEENKQYLN